jgi:hypothetical protein
MVRAVHISQFFKRFSCVEFRTTGIVAGFGRSESQRTALSMLDRLVLNRVCPGSWKYVVSGIAEK